MRAVLRPERFFSATTTRAAAGLAAAALAAGCSTRAIDVKPLPADPAAFAAWDCVRIDDELDTVQQRAAEVAYAVDERLGNNVVALGFGLTIFWPAILAMRPDGADAAELSTLKGRDEALRAAARAKGCPPATAELPPSRAAALPVAVGDRLVYDDRPQGGAPGHEWSLRVTATRRDEIDFKPESAAGAWRQDMAGNVIEAPPGALYWKHLLRHGLALGQVMGGEISIAGDPWARARVRAQVVAVGPLALADRHFDAAVLDLFGDAQRGDERGDQSSRLVGSITVDRTSGVLLNFELRSATPGFNIQRRLARVERPAAPGR